MARVHYAKVVKECFARAGLDYVGWSENAVKVPQARPIERMWSLCKRKLMNMNLTIKNEKHMRKMWSKVTSEVENESGAALMRHLRSKIRKIGSEGVYAVD